MCWHAVSLSVTVPFVATQHWHSAHAYLLLCSMSTNGACLLASTCAPPAHTLTSWHAVVTPPARSARGGSRANRAVPRGVPRARRGQPMTSIDFAPACHAPRRSAHHGPSWRRSRCLWGAPLPCPRACRAAVEAAFSASSSDAGEAAPWLRCLAVLLDGTGRGGLPGGMPLYSHAPPEVFNGPSSCRLRCRRRTCPRKRRR